MERAAPLLQESLAIARESAAHSPSELALSLANVADVFAEQHNWSQAESLLMEAYRTLQTASPADASRRRKLAEQCLAFYTAWAQAAPEAGVGGKTAEWKKTVESF